ncbi:murein DD-endopeptidase MepM/ murein hydrolase activator NlpD/cell division protein FtsB [Kaistia dalseonensis]|uniref:Murein DD-endopeptidase MepM/ murein hydrolase activator NlpD/cell division protein FtsB n=1 Tax=Kaistia dalseonensis TaxID=410840 RepID=A0ABU0H2Q6_9HYPH|nr:peptidoglycan DD-metalloendopeptidase family protein [Kaistia dalseonensis]MDQ0436060.1 murein DD-endopeptidase MepM/ murein hydrolase activator NlpD/cell division protein FtsB [Kaistia dalseonensis]
MPRHVRSRSTRLVIERGDRTQAIHFRPQTIVLGGICVLLFLTLYFGATAYLVFRDDLKTVTATREETLRQQQELEAQALKKQNYEEKIATLREQIDQINSSRAADHATVAQKVDILLDRQQALGKRQDMLAKLTEAARRAGFDIPPVSTKALKPQASIAPVANPDVALGDITGSIAPAPRAALSEGGLARIEKQISAMENQQVAVVDTMSNRLAKRTERIASVLKKLGRPIPKSLATQDVGGPFIPLPEGSAQDFKLRVQTLQGQLERYAMARKIALALPLKRPLGNAPITSRFGARVDPFLGRPAMHPGIDFQAPNGTPARAVAAGTVVAAQWNSGGYGNMVDIDHGNGVITRYGHLSAITVKDGDKVGPGDKIGRVGSTGRSTGPHLHYEIRINGEPIDPMRYLTIGQEIAVWL